MSTDDIDGRVMALDQGRCACFRPVPTVGLVGLLDRLSGPIVATRISTGGPATCPRSLLRGKKVPVFIEFLEASTAALLGW